MSVPRPRLDLLRPLTITATIGAFVALALAILIIGRRPRKFPPLPTARPAIGQAPTVSGLPAAEMLADVC